MEWEKLWTKDFVEIWKTPTAYCVCCKYLKIWKFVTNANEAKELALDLLIATQQ